MFSYGSSKLLFEIIHSCVGCNCLIIKLRSPCRLCIFVWSGLGDCWDTCSFYEVIMSTCTKLSESKPGLTGWGPVDLYTCSYDLKEHKLALVIRSMDFSKKKSPARIRWGRTRKPLEAWGAPVNQSLQFYLIYEVYPPHESLNQIENKARAILRWKFMQVANTWILTMLPCCLFKYFMLLITNLIFRLNHVAFWAELYWVLNLIMLSFELNVVF